MATVSPQSPSEELGSALEDGRDDVEADLVRLLKEDRVLVSESEEESSD